MEDFIVIYKRKDWNKPQAVKVRADNEEEVKEQFKMDLFKNCEIIKISRIF